MKRHATVLLLGILLLSSCRQEAAPPAAKKEQGPRVESTKHGPVTAQVTVAPGRVSISRNAILTLTVTHPPEVTINVPDLTDRVHGFAAGHSFDRTLTRSGQTVFERIVRLTPEIAETYRIAPVPITYSDPDHPGRQRWFPTPPVMLEAETHSTNAKYEERVAPVWIMPTATEIALYAGLALLGIAVILVLIKLIKMAARQVRLLRMSPRERALEELRLLLEKDLVGRELVKEFYLELTMIVRMFIERGYRIRAPEQTTEEFLESASHDNRFAPAVLEKLRSFLQSADLVKFAGFQPDHQSTDKAVKDARNFIRIQSTDNPDAGRKQEVDDA